MNTTEERRIIAHVPYPPHPLWIAAFNAASSGVFVFLSKISDATFMFFAIAILIPTIILNILFKYRLWQLAQYSALGINKPTPGLAVGLCFIPLFGYYWWFIAYRNLALHLNGLTNQNNVPVKLVVIYVALTIPTDIYCNYSYYVSGSNLDFLFIPSDIIYIINSFYFYKSARELLTPSNDVNVL